MKARDVEIGGRYLARVNDTWTPVRIDRNANVVWTKAGPRHGGWLGTVLRTNQGVLIRTSARLRKETS